MTASDAKLTSTPDLIVRTLSFYKTHARILIGYSAWLLVPLVINVLITVTFGASGETVNQFVTATLTIMLSLWLWVFYVLLIPELRKKRPRKNLQPIVRQAWALLPGFTVLTIITTFFELTGFLALIIPGFIVMTWFLFAEIIFIYDGVGVKEALTKSRALTRPVLLPLLRRYIGGTILISIFYLTFLGLWFFLLAAVGNTDLTQYLSGPPTLLQLTVERLADVLFVPLFALFYLFLYEDVKRVSQG